MDLPLQGEMGHMTFSQNTEKWLLYKLRRNLKKFYVLGNCELAPQFGMY